MGGRGEDEGVSVGWVVVERVWGGAEAMQCFL